jgi:hypothetical protein
MAILGSLEVVADNDVKMGEKITIPSLFSISERNKEYQLLEDIKEDAKIRVDIAKVQPFESTADATVKKGQKVSCWRLVRYPDFNGRELVASEDIRKGDKLKITYEAL